MLTWPLNLKPASQSFYIRTNTAQFRSPLTNQVQTLERDGALWVAKLSLTRGIMDTRRLEAFLASLQGPAGIVLLPDFRRLNPQGSLAGSPQLVSGSGTSLVVHGFTPSAAGVLKVGDLIQTSAGRMHMVVQDIDADENGYANVTIRPRLRDAITTGALITQNVRAQMQLTSDDAGSNDTDYRQQTRFQLEFTEVLPT